MNILAITRVYYGPGSNGPQGEQRDANGNEEEMKKLAAGGVHKYTGKVKTLVGPPPFQTTPDYVYIYHHSYYSNNTHDYFTIGWIDR